MTSNLPKLTRFFTNYLLPELLTRQFKLTGVPHDPHSSDADNDGDDGIFCLCRETAYGDMVACDGPDCPYEGFHFVCVELKNPKVYGFVLNVMHAHRLLPNGCVDSFQVVNRKYFIDFCETSCSLYTDKN